MDLTGSALVVDDDKAVGEELRDLLSQAGLDAQWVGSAADALTVLGDRFVQVVFTDLRMPHVDGMELLTKIKAAWPEIQVVMISAHGTVATAVEAMKKGASDFVQKPWDRDEILFVAKKELERSAAAGSAHAPPGTVTLGVSPAMKECDEALTKAAKSTATVLLNSCSSPSCSATRRARSPARSRASRAGSSSRRAGRCSSTSSATSPPTCS
jgi:DNA-binding NtrC family response regulator